MSELQTYEFGNSNLTVVSLKIILEELNRNGCIAVYGITPGSVNMLEIGATLMELAKDNVGALRSAT